MAGHRRIYYTMGQVSEMFDLPASTLRFWEQRFKALSPRKNAKGNRLFTPSDIETIKLIYHLTKEKRMTLDGAEAYMTHKKTAAKSELSLVEILQRIRATLVEVRQELESSEVEQKSLRSTLFETEKPQEVIIYSEQIHEEDIVPVGSDKESSSEGEQGTEDDDSPFTQLTLF